MNKREKEALDRHITGNYGEDQSGMGIFADFEEEEEIENIERRREQLLALQDLLRRFNLYHDWSSDPYPHATTEMLQQCQILHDTLKEELQ